MGKNISDAVREICLGLPETVEVSSHGSPDFRVGNRSFASYVINHHGDGRIALWLNMPPGGQALWVEAEPRSCFVPPYVGPRGWLGVQLDQGLHWGTVGALVREAYRHTAPAHLAAALKPPRDIEPPTEGLDPEEFDPLSPPRVQQMLAELRALCLALPEVAEDRKFGRPAWRAGKKTFCTANRASGRLELQFWVGQDRQATLTFDDRYRVPPYSGGNGWIALDVEDGAAWDEVAELARISYRHFALKRMLKALDAADGGPVAPAAPMR